MSIIDRDIEFYKAMAEQHRTDLTRCDPSDEPMHRQRLVGAMGVFAALLTYKTTLPPKAGTAPITSLVVALWGCIALAGCSAIGDGFRAAQAEKERQLAEQGATDRELCRKVYQITTATDLAACQMEQENRRRHDHERLVDQLMGK